MSQASILEKVNFPSDLKSLTDEELIFLCDEIREEIIKKIALIGGHLGASLGVVELTVAIHKVFNAPKDKIIFDVGHQTHAHKILTGRKDKIHTARQKNGLSGFLKPSESEYDTFGAGHSSTSISAALGIAKARSLKKENFDVVAVIGDGAMSAGMAFEAINNAKVLNEKVIIILNDNKMSISPAIGAFTDYLEKISGDKNIKNFFTEMGFNYHGKIDGHDFIAVQKVLQEAKKSEQNIPILIHILTEKGHGFDSPEEEKEGFHAVSTFDPNTKIQHKKANDIPSYTKVFTDSLIKLALKDEKIIAISAAMFSGTGLDRFSEKFPTRTFDVGIAEQHAVTFAAGLAISGHKAFVCIYSTFLQRAYDQVVHDVAIQNLPVKFAIDRAGLVGSDGETHNGVFDISYLINLPNFVIMSPSNEAELVHMVKTAVSIDDRPCAFRYPRGNGVGVELPEEGEVLPIGKGKIISEGADAKFAFLSLGTVLQNVKEAAKKLKEKGHNSIIADARFAKPFDQALVKELVKKVDNLIIIEEGSSGGFGAHITEYLLENNLHQNKKIRSIHLPDRFIAHQSQTEASIDAGIDENQIVETALKLYSA